MRNYFLAITDQQVLINIIYVLAALLFFALVIILVFTLSVYRANSKDEKTVEERSIIYPQIQNVEQEEIFDEDMMVAALVATIDYANITKKDVRVLSVKKIG
jgi:hypothetical protein